MLSKETTDQIRKEAESVKSIDNDDHAPSLINGYIVGAMRWAIWKEKAEGLAKALKPLAELDLTGVTGGIVYQRNNSQITILDVITARELLLQLNIETALNKLK